MNKLKLGEAKASKKCATCPTVWEIGAKFYMVIDPIQNKLTDVICLKCGNDAYEKQELSPVSNTSTSINVVKSVGGVDREILGVLKEVRSLIITQNKLLYRTLQVDIEPVLVQDEEDV